MFSGIIEYLGTVSAVTGMGRGKKMAIEAGHLVQQARPGDSIAVNGACLTVISVNEQVLEVEAVAETLSKTNLGELTRGSRVNLERPLQAEARVHGHWVLGHVDSTVRVTGLQHLPESVLMSFELTREIKPFIVARGSIAVDGVSLTVARLDESAFTCSLIGYTLSHTNLGAREVGQRVNIETDIIGKYVVKTLGGMVQGGGAITEDKLRNWGY
jgi:riboflavin synthase